MHVIIQRIPKRRGQYFNFDIIQSIRFLKTFTLSFYPPGLMALPGLHFHAPSMCSTRADPLVYE